MANPRLISYHGCHSGQFCTHAGDRLEDMVKMYIQKGFYAIGITEHIPPPEDRFRYADEIAAGQTLAFLNERFDNYCRTVRHLKKKYAGDITIYLAFETESYTGYLPHVRHLVQRCRPDYILGSVHHVRDLCFDYSASHYLKAAGACGGMDNLYHEYFDLQYDLIRSLRPSVVAHFDIIRIHDPDYKERIQTPEIRTKTIRNLKLIKKLGLLLDFNLRPLSRGEAEPYLSGMILDLAKELGIRAVPGEDSHCIDDIGRHIHHGIRILEQKGFSTDWPEPRLYDHGENYL